MLAKVKDDYDYILIDCSPSLGLLTVNSLAAANSVMIPVQCQYFALEGLGKLLNTIKIIQKRLNTALEIEGFVLTMYDGVSACRTKWLPRCGNISRRWFSTR